MVSTFLRIITKLFSVWLEATFIEGGSWKGQRKRYASFCHFSPSYTMSLRRRLHYLAYNISFTQNCHCHCQILNAQCSER